MYSQPAQLQQAVKIGHNAWTLSASFDISFNHEIFDLIQTQSDEHTVRFHNFFMLTATAKQSLRPLYCKTLIPKVCCIQRRLLLHV